MEQMLSMRQTNLTGVVGNNGQVDKMALQVEALASKHDWPD